MELATIVETSRLRLRSPSMDDASAIFTLYAQDPEVTKYLVWRPHQSIETTRDFLRRCAAVREHGTVFPWVITRKEDDQLLGMVELRVDGYRAELGYVLARPFWGQGFATEAVRGLVALALAQATIYRVWAVCDTENHASTRVLEKAGMQREGVLRRWSIHPNVSDQPRDCFCYAKVKEPRHPGSAPPPLAFPSAGPGGNPAENEMIELRNVAKVYEADGNRVEALRGVSLEVGRGEFVALVGPSGCGKSTLLNIVGGIDVPTAGEVVVDGTALSGLSDRALSLYRREKVGFVHQLFNLLPTLTAVENVALPLLLKGVGGGEAREQAWRQLEAVGVGQRGGHWPHQLSGGEQQRVAIARAIVHGPPIILADEPTGNLDSKAGTEVLDLLAWLVMAQGRTLLLATHSRTAAARAARVVPLRDGVVGPAGAGEER